MDFCWLPANYFRVPSTPCLVSLSKKRCSAGFHGESCRNSPFLPTKEEGNVTSSAPRVCTPSRDTSEPASFWRDSPVLPERVSTTLLTKNPPAVWNWRTDSIAMWGSSQKTLGTGTRSTQDCFLGEVRGQPLGTRGWPQSVTAARPSNCGFQDKFLHFSESEVTPPKATYMLSKCTRASCPVPQPIPSVWSEHMNTSVFVHMCYLGFFWVVLRK